MCGGAVTFPSKNTGVNILGIVLATVGTIPKIFSLMFEDTGYVE